MNKSSSPYHKSFFLALGVHALVLGILLCSVTSKERKPVIEQPIISAQIITEFKSALPKEESVLASKPLVPQAQPQVQEDKHKPIDPKILEAKKEALEKARIANLEKIKQKEEAQKLAQEKLLQAQKDKALELAKLKQEKAAKLAQEKIEQEKIAQEKRAQEQLQREQVAQAQARQEAMRQDALKAEQMQAAQQAFLRTIDRYALLMRAKIHQNWRRPLGIENIYKCKVAVRLQANGEVISAIVVNSSGNIEFDRSAELAVRKSSPLPMPPDEKMRAPFNQFTFTFDPETA